MITYISFLASSLERINNIDTTITETVDTNQIEIDTVEEDTIAENEMTEESQSFHQILKTKFIEGGAGFMGIVLLTLILGLHLLREFYTCMPLGLQ